MKSTADFTDITVWGARGHSALVMQGMQDRWQGRVTIRAIIDDVENGFDHPLFQAPVISGAERLKRFSDLPVMLTMGSPSLRAQIYDRLDTEGATLANAIGPASYVSTDAIYGHGTLTAPYTRIGPNVRFGADVQCLANLVSHDIEFGDHVTLGFGSSVLGHVRIGSDVLICPGAMIGNGNLKKQLVIGDGARIAPGAVVLTNVAPGAHVVGNPAVPVDDWAKSRRHQRSLSKEAP